MSNAFDSIIRDIPPSQRLAVGVGAIVVVAATVAAIAWALAPRKETLYRELAAADTDAVVAALDRWGVPYEIGEDGRSVLVARDEVPAARMRLASEGLPGKESVGFELFDESGYGMTEFTQRINYQRALQGELERTIDALEGVARARVHLTLRRGGLFPNDAAPPKGSVTVDLEPGAQLGNAAIEGIRLLVSGAVEGLEPDAVTVIDGSGRSLAGDAVAGGDLQDRTGAERGRAAELERKVATLLSSIFELDRFTVSVDVRLNFDKVREVRDELIAQGDGSGALTHRRQSESRADAKAAADARGSTITEVDYAHGKSHQERVVAPGRVERITVAVLVPRDVDAATLQRLREVIAAAIGLDLARGDRIELGALKPGVAERPAAPPSPSPVSTSAHEPSPAASVAPDPMQLVYLLGAVLVALVVLVGLVATRRPRLSAEERAATVARVQSFLQTPSTERAA